MRRSSLEPQDIRALDPAERFLLWAMRAWVQCCKTKTLPAVVVETAFADIGLPEAAGLLDDALRHVAHSTIRPLMVHSPHCPGFSDDERRLVGAVAAAQNQDFEVAHDLLNEIALPPGAERVLKPLRDLGLLLALAGIDLPRRDYGEPEEDCGLRAPAFHPATLH